ncbi:MAG: acyl-CoA dehydrogenase family protein, partial [Anaerolineales bacterium]|nr:acyl-CoA dehydrogenase family protein [Anaerolineales bacterium]
MGDGFDFLGLDGELTDAQRAVRDAVRRYSVDVVRPRINAFWEAAEFPLALALGLRELPIMGGMLQGHGCAGLDALTAGLVRYELARGDGSIGTFYGVHAGLAMGSIGLLGSEAQKERWLPRMAALDLIGAFALTEPERGSDAAHVLTTARRDGDDWVLNGRKRWIGNAPIADLII